MFEKIYKKYLRKVKKRWCIYALGLMMLFSVQSQAQLANCSQATVQAAINTVSSGGSATYNIPSGACSWNNLAWTNKNITLIGAGNTSDSSVSTVITSTGIGAINITMQAIPFRISNFRFLTGSGVLDVIIAAQSSSFLDTKVNDIRIDHNYFDDQGNGGNAIDLTGRLYGVADHNYFLYVGGAQISLKVEDGVGETDSNINALSGTKSWARASSLGTADAMYYEDNTFDSQIWPTGNIGDGTAGQRMVVRHNKFIGGWAEDHGAYSRGSRGTMQWEVYENDFIPWDGICCFQFQAIKVRGGSGVIFNNRFHQGTWDSAGPIYFDNERSRDANGHAPLNSRCDGNATGIDNNTGFMGYPCLDQIGRGPGAMGSLSSLPALEWNNNLCNGFTVLGACASPTATHPKIDPDGGTQPFQSDHIQQNRDWCNVPGNTGTTASITCNSVVMSYTAFTYPHPDTNSGTKPAGQFPRSQ